MRGYGNCFSVTAVKETAVKQGNTALVLTYCKTTIGDSGVGSNGNKRKLYMRHCGRGELARIGLGPVMLVKLIPTFDVFMSYTRSTQAKIFSSKRNTKKRTELDSCQNPSTLLCVSYCLIVKEALFLSQKNTN